MGDTSAPRGSTDVEVGVIVTDLARWVVPLVARVFATTEKTLRTIAVIAGEPVRSVDVAKDPMLKRFVGASWKNAFLYMLRKLLDDLDRCRMPNIRQMKHRTLRLHRKSLMSRAHSGVAPPPAGCDHLRSEFLRLGRSFGIPARRLRSSLRLATCSHVSFWLRSLTRRLLDGEGEVRP